MSQYQAIARNFSSASENRIHSDEMARKFGFRGALVPGVAVYGHLTLPLVDHFGADWLRHSADSVRLLKPAYHDDRLLLSLDQHEGGHRVQCHNQAGELLAVLNSQQAGELPPPQDLQLLDGQQKSNGRVEITWDSITEHEPFAPWDMTLTAEASQTYRSQVADELSVYDEAQLVHPHLLLSLANTALMQEYVMPTWIHVGSETCHRLPLYIGDSITVKAVPLEKWRKKGHEFIRLWVTYWRGTELTTDILHTAIYKVAG